jgi:hypothetical protein
MDVKSICEYKYRMIFNVSCIFFFLATIPCYYLGSAKKMYDEPKEAVFRSLLSEQAWRGKTIGEEKKHFRRVCRHAIGATDEGLLLAAADNNTFSRRRGRRHVHMHTGGHKHCARTMAMALLPLPTDYI